MHPSSVLEVVLGIPSKWGRTWVCLNSRFVWLGMPLWLAFPACHCDTQPLCNPCDTHCARSPGPRHHEGWLLSCSAAAALSVQLEKCHMYQLKVLLKYLVIPSFTASAHFCTFKDVWVNVLKSSTESRKMFGKSWIYTPQKEEKCHKVWFCIWTEKLVTFSEIQI